MLNQEPAKEFPSLCQEKGIGVFVGGVYNTGNLATGPVPGAFYEYQTYQEAADNKVEFIDVIYNPMRLHSGIDYLPPIEFEAAATTAA